jgi:hypothetical protein
VRAKRRRGHGAGQHLCRHRGGDHIGVALSVDGLVTNPRNDHTPLAAALVRELGRFIEAVTHDFAFGDEFLQMRVWDLDALLFEGQIAQVAPTGAGVVLALATGFAIGGIDFGVGGCLASVVLFVWLLVGDAERACNLVELSQLLGKLNLELLGIGALRLGNEESALEEVELLAQALVRST